MFLELLLKKKFLKNVRTFTKIELILHLINDILQMSEFNFFVLLDKFWALKNSKIEKLFSKIVEVEKLARLWHMGMLSWKAGAYLI